MKELDITLKLEFGIIKIYFEDILHLKINKDKLLGIQSWIYDEKFYIEYTFDGNLMETEYDNIDKWKKILKLLDEYDRK